MLRRLLLLTTLAAALAAGTALVPAAAPASAVDDTGSSPTVTTEHDMTVGPLQRHYTLVTPAVPAGPLGLVVVMHGIYSNYDRETARSGLNALAESGRYAVAWPQGLYGAWNAGGGCCAGAGQAGIDDLRFLDRMVAEVSTLLPVDARRVSAVGFSVGGYMAYRLACDRSGTFAAVVAISASLSGSCAGGQPVSVLAVHGTADPDIPYSGTKYSSVIKMPVVPVASVISGWLHRDGCVTPDFRTRSGSAYNRLFDRCPTGIAVQVLTYPGVGHWWPDESGDGAVLPIIENFLDKHSRTAAAS